MDRHELMALVEREMEAFIEWPTEDRSQITTTSAKLFAEHVAQLMLAHVDVLVAENDKLRGLVHRTIDDYIRPEIRHEKEAFAGHERCSNLAGLQLELEEFEAALARPAK